MHLKSTRKWALAPAVMLLAVAARLSSAQTTKVCTPVAGGSVICTESKPATVGGAVASGMPGVIDGLAKDRADNAARASAQASSDARAQLFVDRAVMVLGQGRDSLAFSSADRAAKLDSLYWDEASRKIGLLYSVDPAATTQQMRETIEPVIDKYRRLKRTPT